MLKNGTKFIYRETDKETLNLVLKYLENLPLEIKHYGQNVISKNMIIADRKKLLNGNSFILGVSGR